MNEEEFIEELDDEDELDDHMLEMNNKPHNSKVETNWGNVLMFLIDKHREIEMKETERMVEKQQLKLKISLLEVQNKVY